MTNNPDPFDENYDQNETIAENDRLSQDESGYSGEGDCGEESENADDDDWLDDIWDWLTDDEDEDEDDNGSGLDGMEGDFDPSQEEMSV